MVREYGRAPRGKKVAGVTRGRKFQRKNVVAGLCRNKILAPLCYNHTANGDFFEAWFEDSLLKKVRKGSTIIMDNASFHRKARLQKIADKKGRFLLWLSPYSPDLNPIEKTWANMKHALIDSLPHYTSLEDAVYQYLNI